MALRGVLAVFVVAGTAVSTTGTLASAVFTSIFSFPHTHLSLQTQVLQELVAGPLAGRDLVLYLDPGLGQENLRQITTLLALQYSPIFLVNLDSDGGKWCQEQSLPLLRADYLIHVVLFISDPRLFFRSVVNADIRWKPKYFLMFSFSSELKSKILKSEEFSRPEKIVLFKQQISRKKILGGQMEMFTYFPFSRGTQLASLGLWSVTAGLTTTNIFVDRFSTFEGYRFLLGTWFIDEPYLYQAKDKQKNEGDGLSVEILNALSTQFNYSFHLTTEPPDVTFGDFVNGSWTGMLGMIHRGEAHFTVNSFTYNNKRIEDFDASVSYWMEGFGLALLKPQPLAKWRSVYYPFTAVVWASMAFSFSIVNMFFYLQVSMQSAISKYVIQRWASFSRKEPTLLFLVS